jgi:hypothetical protein
MGGIVRGGRGRGEETRGRRWEKREGGHVTRQVLRYLLRLFGGVCRCVSICILSISYILYMRYTFLHTTPKYIEKKKKKKKKEKTILMRFTQIEVVVDVCIYLYTY